MLKPLCELSDSDREELFGNKKELQSITELKEEELFEDIENEQPVSATRSILKGVIVADGPEELPPEPDPPKGTRKKDHNGITKEWNGQYWITITNFTIEREAHEQREKELIALRQDVPTGPEPEGKQTNVYSIYKLEANGSERFMDSRGYYASAMRYAFSLLRGCKRNPKVIRIKNKNSPYSVDVYWNPPTIEPQKPTTPLPP